MNEHQEIENYIAKKSVTICRPRTASGLTNREKIHGQPPAKKLSSEPFGTWPQPEQQQQAKALKEALEEKLNPTEPPETKGEQFNLDSGEVFAEPDEPVTAQKIEGEVDPVELIKHISVGSIGGSPERAKIEKTRVPVWSVFGRATDTQIVLLDPTGSADDPRNKSVALTGAFQAVNLHTHAQYASGVLFLHQAFQKFVVEMLESQKYRRGNSKPFRGVEFAYQIDAVPAPNPAGYSYVLRNLLPPSRADTLAHLRERTFAIIGKEHPKLLPAPLPPMES